MNPQARQRLQQLMESWDQFPGRAPNGTGLTGLEKNDAHGWSDLLNEQTEGVNLQNELAGKGPLQVRAVRGGGLAPMGGPTPGVQMPFVPQSIGAIDPADPSQEQWMARTKKKIYGGQG